ncbi:MAG: hypothetical protein ACE5OZ_25935 [Candidatus Heimdallarchaeota archaeon]
MASKALTSPLLMPVETQTATQRMVNHFNGLPFIRASLVAETGSLRALA